MFLWHAVLIASVIPKFDKGRRWLSEYSELGVDAFLLKYAPGYRETGQEKEAKAEAKKSLRAVSIGTGNRR